MKIYDNGGKTFDRYTAVFITMPESYPGSFEAIGMSSSPFSPQGFGQHCSAMPGRHLGKLIEFKTLPSDCQKLVLRDLKEIVRYHEGLAANCEPYCNLQNEINEMFKELP